MFVHSWPVACCLLLLFLPWGVALFVLDAHTSRLPNVLTLPAFAVAAAVPAMIPGANSLAFLGGLGWCAIAFALPAVHPRLLAGGGDAKLALSTGTLASIADPLGAFVAMALSGILHSVFVSPAKVARGADRIRGTPHGPAMLVGSGIVVVASIVLIAP
ncbi:prepilin peptidase [Corynebacterium macclintockiae]|uniref:prepilin peptidase n=1 Tax=Corynebacterium macclintockiae TaxID=2913501 RepID=UPI003EC042DD